MLDPLLPLDKGYNAVGIIKTNTKICGKLTELPTQKFGNCWSWAPRSESVSALNESYFETQDEHELRGSTNLISMSAWQYSPVCLQVCSNNCEYSCIKNAHKISTLQLTFIEFSILRCFMTVLLAYTENATLMIEIGCMRKHCKGQRENLACCTLLAIYSTFKT